MRLLLPACLLLVACDGGEDTDDRIAAIVALDGDAAVGAEVFAAECASCHGADGEGGSGPPLDGVPAAHTPEELAGFILDGIGSMPAHDYMSDQEIADVLAHMDATW